MGKLDGKVAFITGAARGQGRSHAVRLAEEGADIIAVDLCGDIASNHYPLGTWDELQETAALVEKYDRRAIVSRVDVRDAAGIRQAMADGVAELGHLDIVVANAGISPLDNPDVQSFQDAIEVDLVGVINVMGASLAHVKAGASLIATGSVAAFLPGSVDNPAAGPGGAGYGFAKRTLALYIHELARQLAPQSIRANVVHPTNCNTGMLNSDPMYRVFRPDLEHPTREDALEAFPAMQALPVPYIEPNDISNAVVFLASDDARYVTGLQFRVDAGAYLNVAEPFRI
ncbi:MAG: short-chain dehydorgenase/reductase [Frankiales bacterium]|nr:short-chain dehydorgenase/reductase [Frankiales bacterium]